MYIKGSHSAALFTFYKHNNLYYIDIDSKHNIWACLDADDKHNNWTCPDIGVVIKAFNGNTNACRSSCDFYSFYQ